MIDFYKQEIEKVAMEKIATRAWKKNFALLGDKSKQKLINAGVLDYKKELQGIRRGTHALNLKNDIKLTRKAGPFGGVLQEDIDNQFKKGFRSTPYKQYAKEELEGQKGKDLIAETGAMNMVSSTGEKFKSAKGKGGMQYVPKGAYNKLTENPSLQSIGFGKENRIPRRDRESKKWVQAILERHEADEGRYGRAIKEKDKYRIDDQAGVKTRYASHINPKVLARESTNVAIAPPQAQEYMRKLRTPTGELVDFPNRYGQEYGVNPVYNKKLGNKMEKSVRNDINKSLQEYKTYGYDIKPGWHD